MATITSKPPLTTLLSSLSNRLESLTFSPSLHPDQQHIEDKTQLLFLLEKAHKTPKQLLQLFKQLSTPFPVNEAASKLNTIKSKECLIKDLLRESNRLNLNTFSALNLDSPSHTKQKKHREITFFEALDVESRTTSLNFKINKAMNALVTLLPFKQLPTSEQLSEFNKRVSLGFSYLITPLEYLIYSNTRLTSDATVSIPITTDDFIQNALNGCSIASKDLLGKGTYGSVNLVKVNGKSFAVKSALTTDSQAFLKMEASLYMTLNHPNIVELHSISQSGLYLERMDKGDLFEAISSTRFKAKEAKNYLLDITRALSYIHEKGYTYKDLKPENILISSTGQAKLCDFGLTRRTKDDIMQAGSPFYTAPEVNLQLLSHPDPISNKADIWSLGVVMFEIITGGMVPYPPTPNTEPAISYCQRLAKRINNPCNEKEIFRSIDNNSQNKKIMTQRDPKRILRSLIVKCLHGDASLRPSLQIIESTLNTIEESAEDSTCIVS